MTTLGQDRAAFVRDHAPALATAVAAGVTRWTTAMALSRGFGWFADDDCLVVVATPHEDRISVDRGLAFGVAHAGDRQLKLVLPAGSEQPTRRRLPWIDAPVSVFTYGPTHDVNVVSPYAQAEVLALQTDELVTAIHHIADRRPWVERLVQWADTTPELVPAHRKSYLAWHCRGRLVLRIRKRRGGIVASAGVHSSAATDDLTVVDLTAPMTSEQFHRLTSTSSRVIADRLGGADVGHAEHQLQERLAALRSELGLRTVRREFPAMRPVDNRGFIDLLGVGRDGALHVVETKIGPDPMLVLQGLDYYIWLSAHRTEVAAHLSSEMDEALDPTLPIALDFVIGPKAGAYVSPYTAAQAEALDGGIRWQFHTVDDWDRDDTRIASLARRTPPPAPRAAPARFAQALEVDLVERSSPHLHRRVLFTTPAGGVVPAALPTYEQLRTSGRLHRYVDHVRSSQAFTLNLFADLTEAEQQRLWSVVAPGGAELESVELEYVDPQDALAERQPHRPHQTQVDVALRGTTTDARRVVALVEVKLSETTFGTCSAFDAATNERRDVCSGRGPWGGDALACFQLSNHGGPHRRRYADHLDPSWLTTDDLDGCPFRELNQPMRNVALARALIDREEADEAVVALCAPLGNANVWRQWRRAHTAFSSVPHVTLVDLPAGVVIAQLDEERRELLHGRYGQLGGS